MEASRENTVLCTTCLAMSMVCVCRVYLEIHILFTTNDIPWADNIGGLPYNDTEDNNVTKHANESSSNYTRSSEFEWDASTQAFVLSSYYWGYSISQIPGAIIAEQVSLRWTMYFALVMSTASSIFLPRAARMYGAGAVVLYRVAQGFAGGLSMPCILVILRRCTNFKARSHTTSFVYSGTSIGIVIAKFIGFWSFKAEVDWAITYMVLGVLVGTASVAWILNVRANPEEISLSSFRLEGLSVHAGSEEENNIDKMVIPWMKMFRCRAFWGICLTQAASDWWFQLILNITPLYYAHYLMCKYWQVAVLTTIPYMVMGVYSVLLAWLLDNEINRDVLTASESRKIAMLTATIVPAVCFLSLSLAVNNKVSAQVLIAIIIVSYGGLSSAIIPNYLDIAPNFTAPMSGVANMISAIPSSLTSLLIMQVHKQNTKVQWGIIYGACGGLCTVVAVLYLILVDSELRAWNFDSAMVETNSTGLETTEVLMLKDLRKTPSTSRNASTHSLPKPKKQKMQEFTETGL